MRADASPARVIDRRDYRVVDPDRAGFDNAQMDEQIAQFLLRIGDADAEIVARDSASVANLTAALGIKRGLVQDDRDFGPGSGFLH